MSVSKNRLSNTNLVELIETEFDKNVSDAISKVEPITKGTSNLASEAKKLGKSTPFETLMGTLGDVLADGKCEANINSFDRKDRLAILDDNMNDPYMLRECGDPLTRILKALKVVDTFINNLSDFGISRLEGIVNQSLAPIKGVYNQMNAVYDDVRTSIGVVNQIIDMLNVLGGTLKQKLSLKALDSLCGGFGDLGSLNMLNNFLLGVSLEALNCEKGNKLLEFTRLLENSKAFPKRDIVKGYVNNFKGKEEKVGYEKLLILHNLIKRGKTEGVIDETIIVHTSDKADTILYSLTLPAGTLQHDKDFINVISALDEISPEWYKDNKGNGYSEAMKDNSALFVMARNYINAMSSTNGLKLSLDVNDQKKYKDNPTLSKDVSDKMLNLAKDIVAMNNSEFVSNGNVIAGSNGGSYFYNDKQDILDKDGNVDIDKMSTISNIDTTNSDKVVIKVSDITKTGIDVNNESIIKVRSGSSNTNSVIQELIRSESGEEHNSINNVNSVRDDNGNTDIVRDTNDSVFNTTVTEFSSNNISLNIRDIKHT